MALESMLRDFWQDVRFGVRMLLKRRRFALLVVTILALGSGANAAIFSIVNAVLLRPLPYKEPDRLVAVSEKLRQGNASTVSLPDFLDWRSNNKVFEQMAAYRWQAFSLTGRGEPEMVHGWYASADFFPLLGVKPALGRTFTAEEDRPGGTPVVVISYGLWQRHFGGDPNLIGQAITLNGTNYTVIGIAPQRFRFEEPIDAWLPLGLWADDMMYRTFRSASAIARLKPNVTLEQARANMEMIGRQLEEQYPESNKGVRTEVVPLHDVLVQDARPALLVLLGAVGCVLAIACLNVAVLLIVRASSRRKEIAVRIALGAGRGRLIRQLLTESILLSAVGSCLGLLLARLTFRFIISILPSTLPRIEDLDMDARVLAFTLLTALLTGIIFGIAPALQSSQLNLTDALKEGGRTDMQGGGINRTRGILVVGEVALSIVLMVGAGLLIKSFIRLLHASPGFDPNNVLVMNLSMPFDKYPKHDERRAFYENLLRRVEALPGVEQVAASNPPPLNSVGYKTSVLVEGQALTSAENMPSVDYALVSPRYFEALRIPLLKGRLFDERDREGRPPVVIIDDALANRLFASGEDPIGKRLRVDYLGDIRSDNLWVEIVGVVRRVENYGLHTESRVQMYVPYLQAPLLKYALMVRTKGSDPLSLGSSVRREVLAVDPGQPVYNIRTMEQDMAEVVAPQRLLMLLLGFFAAFALLLAAIGLYGVMSYAVEQRRHEIGIRMALGAQARDVQRLIVYNGLKLTIIGIAFGLLLALGLSRLISSMLYEVGATDPPVYAGITFLLALVSLVACYAPARAATKVDPLVVLRGTNE
jgi:putative ABC transport system permease protein